MKIVIDISDYDYEYILNNCIVPIKYDNLIYEAIRCGTVLPKGHGRLIDADNLPLNAIDDANYGSNYIKIAPTIIEADKGEQ